jgi:hypothetical protein
MNDIIYKKKTPLVYKCVCLKIRMSTVTEMNVQEIEASLDVLDLKEKFIDALIGVTPPEQEYLCKNEMLAVVNSAESVSRYNELSKCLSKYGLILRNDSMLCKSYIRDGTFEHTMKTVDDICRTLYNSEYFYKVIKVMVDVNATGPNYNNRVHKVPRHVYNKQMEERVTVAFMKKYDIRSTVYLPTVSCIKYIIDNPSKFDLSNVNAAKDKYPW